MAEEIPAEIELPRGVALAWGVAANPQRGPKREMSVERIVDVAVDLADAGGLSAVSMSAVAVALGFTPMSLYRYVTAKDDLVLLMQEQGVGVPPETVTEATSDGWRAGLETWARAMTDVYVEHSWLLDIPIQGTPTTPNNLAWLEAALGVLEPVGISLDGKVSIVLALIAQARWEGLVRRGIMAEAAATGASVPELDRRDNDILATLVTADEFPLVRAALDAGVFSGPPDAVVPGDPFAFGRDRVLDGVDAFLSGAPRSETGRIAADPLDDAVARDPKVKEAVKARREAEKQVREMRKREREQVRAARERLRR